MTTQDPPPTERLVVGVSARRMIIQGVGAGAFGVLLSIGAVARGLWFLGLLAALMLGVAAFSLYQARNFQPTLIADDSGVSLAKSAADGGTLHLPWEELTGSSYTTSGVRTSGCYASSRATCPATFPSMQSSAAARRRAFE